MDMDNFKQIKDSYGHQKGDRVLLQFSDLLRYVFGRDSIVARIGGDEFVVYLSSIDKPEDVGAICDKLQRELHDVRVGDTPVTISIGAVTATGEDDYDTLYRLADKALYEAKRGQKNQFRMAERE